MEASTGCLSTRRVSHSWPDLLHSVQPGDWCLEVKSEGGCEWCWGGGGGEGGSGMKGGRIGSWSLNVQSAAQG